MDESYESLLSMSEHRPMIVSPYLSTQINETICGCHCGCGCSCTGPGDDEDYERASDSESETAVDSSDYDDDALTSSRQELHDAGLNGEEFTPTDEQIVAPRAISHLGRMLLLGGAADLQLGETLVGWEQTSMRPVLYDGLEDAADSLFNEAPHTDTYNSITSDHDSLRMLSPGPGIGALFISDGTEDIEVVYYFDHRPLRLSAEYEHARGKAVEHSLIPDEVSFGTL